MQITQPLRAQVIVIGVFWIDAALLIPLGLTHDPHLLGAIVASKTQGLPCRCWQPDTSPSARLAA